MANLNLIVKELKRSFEGIDFEKALKESDNEAKTRMYLVEPFFSILGFHRGFDNGNLVPEFDADFANLKGKKVDYAIKFKNKVEIIIEVKKAEVKLTERHLRQLNEYFINTNESKIGILTNGKEYHFYCRNINNGASLHPTPFYSFFVNNIENASLNQLAKFYYTNIEVKSILEEAQELFLIEAFEQALYKEFSEPSRDFIKAIYCKMNGSRMTESIENQIRELISSVSIKSALDKLIVDEANKANSGIITTDQELKYYHVIKTILAQNKQINTESVGYKDFKGKFSIILNNNQKNKVCDLYINPNTQRIEVNGEKFDVPNIDSVLKLKKKLLDQALSLI